MSKKLTQKDIDNMLGHEDFCVVVNDKLEEDGLPSGTNVFIAGTQPVPVEEGDIYDFRLKMLVTKMDADGHVDSSKFYIVDPASLKRVTKARAKKFRRIMEKDFKAPEATKEVVN